MRQEAVTNILLKAEKLVITTIKKLKREASQMMMSCERESIEILKRQ